jgi:hypothetical protein
MKKIKIKQKMKRKKILRTSLKIEVKNLKIKKIAKTTS